MGDVTALPGCVVPDTNMKVIDSTWFTPGGGQHLVGVVLCEDLTMKYVQAYIGTDNHYSTQEGSEQRIAKWGAKITKQHAEALFGYQMPDYKTQ
jgi:hypothetical protein